MRYFVTIVLFLFLLPASSVFAAASATDIPLGQSASSAESLFGTQRGYFHPSVSLSTVYTDNLFNLKNPEENEVITTLTPALWLAFPGSLQPAEPINTETTAAGGLAVSRFAEKDDRPFNAYLNYESGIKRHKNFGSEDITTHKIQGLLRGTLSNGLSLEVSDLYSKNHDAYATGVSIGQSRYMSNMVKVANRIPLGEKMRIRIEYNNFLVDYKAANNNYRDRTDNKVSGFVYYTLSPKTEFFAQYSYLDISYDSNVGSDNRQHRSYLGMEYSVTEKLRALAKIGYNDKDRKNGYSDRQDTVYELQLDYNLSATQNVLFEAWRTLKESDSPGSNGILGDTIRATYSQLIGERMIGSLMAGWSQDDYGDDPREDEYQMVSLSLGYAMQKWFEISCGYNFVRRDSSDNSFNYDSNGLFLSVSGKL